MRRLLRTAALGAWHHSVGRAVARRGGPHLPILLYHGVVPEPLSPRCPWQLPVDVFRRQMEHLAREHVVLPLVEALDRLHAGTLPARACVLTFDDGLRNNLDVAAPVLRALGLPASFYVVTDLVGTGEILWADRAWLAFMRTAQRTVDASDLGLGTLGLGGPAARVRAARAALKVLKSLPSERKDLRLAELLARLGADPEPEPGCFALMDWDEVGRLAADPSFEVGAHGASHEILSRLPHDRVEHETRGAHEHLAREIGRAPTTFAYPNGRPQDHDARAHAALERAGVRYALTTEARRARPADAWWAVPRLDVNSGLPWLRFRMLVEGTLGVLRRMRR